VNAGFSRKVGEANFGSRGASVNLELELESSVVSDADKMHEKIRSLFALAKNAVDEELRNGNGNGKPENNPAASKPEDSTPHATVCSGLRHRRDEREGGQVLDREVRQTALLQVPAEGNQREGKEVAVKRFCENTLCGHPGAKVVAVSVRNARDQRRTLCATCEEVFSWASSTGRCRPKRRTGGR